MAASFLPPVEVLFRSSLDLLIVAGDDGFLKRANPAMERSLGLSEQELVARPYVDFIHPDDRASVIERAAGVFRGAPVTTFECRFRRRDGSYRWMSWTCPAAAPGERSVVASGRDVTDPKRLAEGLASLNRELEAFSYSISHDLRAPLRVIGGYADVLIEDHGPKLSAEVQRLLEAIGRNARGMNALIGGLLEFSRLGRASMEIVDLDLHALVSEVLRDALAASEGRKIDARIGPMPAARGDRMLLRQVLVNLISNAVKYTAPRAEARIEIGGSSEGKESTLFVRDNGVGFDAAYADKLFGVFQRLHGREFEGTGVGLALAQRIIHRHGGRMWAEGVVDGGATFFFSLPRAWPNVS